jgi:hypothetical protein
MAGYALMPNVVIFAPHRLLNTTAQSPFLTSLCPDSASLSRHDEGYFMASSDSPDTSVFEETQISPAITEDEVLQFFQDHGIFYESDAEIGRLAVTLGDEGLGRRPDIARFKEVYMRKPVSSMLSLFCAS